MNNHYFVVMTLKGLGEEGDEYSSLTVDGIIELSPELDNPQARYKKAHSTAEQLFRRKRGPGVDEYAVIFYSCELVPRG